MVRYGAAIFACLRLYACVRASVFVCLRSCDCWTVGFDTIFRTFAVRPLKFQTPERAKIARSGVFLNSFFAVIAGDFFFFRAVGSSSCAKSAVKTAFKRAKHSISDRKSSIHRTSRIYRNKGFKRSFTFYRAGKPFFPARRCSARVRILPAQR